MASHTEKTSDLEVTITGLSVTIDNLIHRIEELADDINNHVHRSHNYQDSDDYDYGEEEKPSLEKDPGEDRRIPLVDEDFPEFFNGLVLVRVEEEKTYGECDVTVFRKAVYKKEIEEAPE